MFSKKNLTLLMLLSILALGIVVSAQDEMTDAVVMWDQFVVDNTVMAMSVTASVDGWLVIHNDNGGKPGPVLGVAQVAAGTTEDVVVTLDMEAEMTQVVWPMLHVDTGTAGEYEFGTVEGADSPVRVNDKVLTFPIWTVPHMRVASQIVDPEAPMILATHILAEVDGWLVIHQEKDGSFGPVAGIAPVTAGINTDVMVELDPAMLTDGLWPMLHVDTGAVGEYEFGTVEGADGPVFVNDEILSFRINTIPSIVYEGSLDGNVLTVKEALIDGPGWLAIHADDNGNPGAGLGATLLEPGLNKDIVVELDATNMTEILFPMLHVDDNTMGEYEFGAVEGADAPLFVGETPVFGPLTPTIKE